MLRFGDTRQHRERPSALADLERRERKVCSQNGEDGVLETPSFVPRPLEAVYRPPNDLGRGLRHPPTCRGS